MASSGTRAKRVLSDSYMARGSARAVGATAAVEEQRVAGHQAPVDQEALAARRVAGRVDELDPDPPTSHHVAAVVTRPIRSGRRRWCARPTAPRRPGRGSAPWSSRAGRRSPRATTRPDAARRHGRRGKCVPSTPVRCMPSRLHDVEQLLHGVGRVDDDRLARLPVTDQVDEVDHLLRDRVAGGRSLAPTAAVGSRAVQPAARHSSASPPTSR